MFVDTNVLVYVHDASETARQPVTQAGCSPNYGGRPHRDAQHPGPPRVLRRRHPQVRPTDDRARPKTSSTLTATGRSSRSMHAVIVAASQLEERHTLSFWDALIVEAARRAGASRLVTEDLQSGRRLASVIIDNPFA